MSIRETCDVLVIGSGAAGMSAAITARLGGLSVIVIEKEPKLGGSTARSGGNMWIPCNHISLADGIDDSPERALAYIQAEAGVFFEGARSQAYLTHAPLMVRAFESGTSAMRFVRNDAVGDNHAHLPGAMHAGRTLTTPPFDGFELGERLKELAPPLPDLTFAGMQIQPGRELNHFFRVFDSLTSFGFVSQRLLRHLRDLLRFGRTTRLANGNALAARLLKSAFDLDVEIHTHARAVRLTTNQSNVTGALVSCDGSESAIVARVGVVLASGGFPHDKERRKALTAGPLSHATFPLAPAGNVGDGLRLAEAVGGQVESGFFNSVSWTPVSKTKHGLFPHGFDRTKPGFIAVTWRGTRFANEALVGNDFIRAMAEACGNTTVEGFLIADHRTVRKYGIGIARPHPMPIGHLIREGYLLRGRTLQDLARQAGIDADALVSTVAAFNNAAGEGEDPLFQRGKTELERRNGDSSVQPNPCLAPITRAPFYAVKLLPGDFSTLAGLRTDEHARVLDARGKPIPGLYAAGNDAQSLFGGNSAAGGATLGPALTFGFIAACDLVRRSELLGEPRERQNA